MSQQELDLVQFATREVAETGTESGRAGCRWDRCAETIGVVSARVRGTIWWDFDGTLVSRPLMWSEAARRLIERASIACTDLPGPLLSVLNNDMPWHAPNRAHPELSTPELWWARVRPLTLRVVARATPAALDALRSEILDPRAYSLFEDVVPVLTALSAEGWRHVIVSNHVPELADIVAGLGISAYLPT
jgi:putative hydrolase of the HAD superfamily